MRGLAAGSSGGGAAVSARAARVLAHLLLDNRQCKQRALTIPLEMPESSSASPLLLMPRCLANLSAALAPTGVPLPSAGGVPPPLSPDGVPLSSPDGVLPRPRCLPPFSHDPPCHAPWLQG